MKKISINLLGALLTMLCFLSSCSKEFTPGDPDTRTTGAYLTQVQAGNNEIDWGNFATSTVTKVVGQQGSNIKEVNVYVMVGASTNKADWKFVKTVPFTDGMTLSVTGAEILSGLGMEYEDVQANMTIYNEVVTTDGRTFSLANTPSNYESFANYKMALKWNITLVNFVCPWDRAFFDGNFKILEDGWGDYSAGDVVGVTPGPGEFQITIALYPPSGARTPLVGTVDPETGIITIPEQVYGSYPGYGPFSAKGTGTVSACSGIISLNLEHFEGGDSYGTYKVEMVKQ